MQNMNARSRKPYRDKVAIVAQILEMACGGAQKTSIMYRVGLSSLMLSRYLELMMNAKLLDVVPASDKVTLKATHRGMEFLYHANEIIELLETEDNNRHKPILISNSAHLRPIHIA
jgi:predicted transcriptional regulator